MKKDFLKGAALLAVSGLICKVLGAIYRVPLANTIGTEGMGSYQMAYPIYSLLVVVSSAGVPVAVSKMVSEECARGSFRGANEVFAVSLFSLLFVGAASSLLLFFAAEPVASAMGNMSAAFSLKMLAPSLVFVAASSAYRGYLQGRQLMGATAVSQITEQLVRLTIGLYIARMWMPRGAAYGSGGALLGVTLSELAGLATIMFYCALKRREFSFEWRADRDRVKTIAKKLFKLAFPVTLGACATAAVSAIDSAVVVRALASSGVSSASAAAQYGLLSGFVQPIVNMPAVLFSALAMSIVPALSSDLALNRTGEAARHAGMAYKTAVILGLPCAAGLFILSSPILHSMFSNLKADELYTAASLLKILAPAVFFMAISAVSAGILQGAGKTVYPVLSMLLGSAVKLFLGLRLIRAVGITGAAWGTFVCFLISASVNTLLVIKHSGVRIKVLPILASPALSAAGMCLLIVPVKNAVKGNAGTWLAILAGAVFYAIILVLTKGVDREYLRTLLVKRGTADDNYSKYGNGKKRYAYAWGIKAHKKRGRGDTADGKGARGGLS